MTDAERCEQLQREIDEARDLLRAAGVTGFGALCEGITQLAERARPGKELDFMVMNGQEVIEIAERIRRRAQAMGKNDRTRLKAALKLEVFSIAVDTLARRESICGYSLLKQIERGLGRSFVAVREFVETEREKD